MAARVHPPGPALGFTLAEIGDLLGPAEARSTADITRAAEAKLAAIAGQIAELAALHAGCGG